MLPVHEPPLCGQQLLILEPPTRQRRKCDGHSVGKEEKRPCLKVAHLQRK